MNPDKRNAAVLIALVASMTVGVVALLSLEPLLYPEQPRWEYNVALTALQAGPVTTVQISHAESNEAASQLAVSPDESWCLIYPNGAVHSEEHGPKWRFVLIGTELPGQQRLALVQVLGRLSRAAGTDLVPVRLDADLDTRSGIGAEIASFLRQKGITRE